MRQLSLRLAFLCLYAMGTLAAAMLPAHAPTASAAMHAAAPAADAADASSKVTNGPQETLGIPPASAAAERPRRAARIDFSMPYYRFGRLPMRL